MTIPEMPQADIESAAETGSKAAMAVTVPPYSEPCAMWDFLVI